MNKLNIFNVAPKIPDKIRFLETLSNNLWWTWNPNANNLFRRIDPDLWYNYDRNPIAMLSKISQERLQELSEDRGFLHHLNEVEEEFHEDLDTDTNKDDECIAYFSLEYGLHESLRLYSGGLGVLAGDHLKSASDLGLSLIGVGLFYREGYFRQHLNNDGWQEEDYSPNPVQYMPMQKAADHDGNEIEVTIRYPDGEVKATIWLVKVGKTQLFLLDTNLLENKPEHRDITARLYGGDRTTRLRQELLLGIGGFDAIRKLGYNPTAFHINEGHAAFLSIARLNYFMQEHNLSFEEALEITNRTKVFTTHTPVPAGNESFKTGLLQEHLTAVMEEYAVKPEDIFSLAQLREEDYNKNPDAELSMTVLGLKTSAHCNGVSKLHGKISKEMWHYLWPNHAEEEVPIHHITNGVHLPTWASEEINRLLERYIGSGWNKRLLNGNDNKSIDSIRSEELWHAHQTARYRLIASLRQRQKKALEAKNAPGHEIERAESILDNDTLTIGFARRFAAYKRATLLLHDIERFKKLITNDRFPVQIIFAGKAHPQDNIGKELIQEIYKLTKDENFSNRILFLEDYDMFIAERLVQGVDVWLNTPRRPREASGTSGMKAALNGVINCSILDGWWVEAYHGRNGWAIGQGETYQDPSYQDHKEAQHLYHILEDEIIPLYYQSKHGQIPERWVELMKESIKTVISHFSSFRMVEEYNHLAYTLAHKNYDELAADNFAACRKNTSEYLFLQNNWHKINISHPEADKQLDKLRVGDEFTVTAHLSLDGIEPELVEVEAFYGEVGTLNTIEKPKTERMERTTEQNADGTHTYSATISCEHAGRYGFTVRVIPKDEVWKDSIPGLIKWAED
ncbi:MAG: alpha-glucan family phosphorylase [Lentisphaeria bacterium]